MRAVLLIFVVLVISAIALFRPRVGLYGYLWFAMMRPDILAWAEGSFPYSMLLAASTALGSLRFLPDLGVVLRNPLCRGLLCLLAVFGLSAVFAVDPSLALEPFQFFLRVALMALLIPLLIRTEEHLRMILLITGISLGLLGAKFGVYGLLAGGVRFSSGHGGMISDNNALALAMAMAVALCWYARAMLSGHFSRLIVLGIVAAVTAGTVMTYSRGAALALGVLFLLIALRSRHKVLTFAGLGAMAGAVILLAGASYVERLSSITAPEADHSATNRLGNYQAAFEMWKGYPVLGVGFGSLNQQQLLVQYIDRDMEKDIVMHSTYLQVLTDSGFLGSFTYLLLLFGTIWWLRRSFRRTREALPGKEIYPAALQASLITFAVGSAFLSRVTFDLLYILLMTSASWWAIERDLFELRQEESVTELELSQDWTVSPAPVSASR